LNVRHRHDVLIIGAGAAGLTLALALAPRARVAVLTKETLSAGATTWAQGGVAAAVDPADSIEAHVADTLQAGAGLCNEATVRFTVERAAAAIAELERAGVRFDMPDDVPGESAPGDAPHSAYHLTREGGHSFRRVLHVADATGSAISAALIERARASDGIELHEHHAAIDLVTEARLGGTSRRVIGAYVLNDSDGTVEVFTARFVVLACGGASKAYLYSTNPDGATGDGIAMAWRAGCRVADMEFNQFHPTCLYHPHAGSFLITEAVRGEGGRLLLPDGTRFMPAFDPRAELAPRDVVARAIDHEMKRLGCDCVYLDISHRSPAFIERHFPTILARCRQLGIDITRSPMPVVPAAHYTCGGVVTDLHGATDLPGLYAVGETSCTGLHGANRMASNSLLECLVFGRAAADHIAQALAAPASGLTIPDWDESRVTDSDEDVVIAHNWDELRRFMWDYVGIVRTDRRLERALHRIELLKGEIADYYGNYRVKKDLIELRNLLLVSELIVRSALARRESRGLHFTLSCPGLLPEARDTVLVPGDAVPGIRWPPTGQGPVG
jgi:L-aspartate oxidase